MLALMKINLPGKQHTKLVEFFPSFLSDITVSSDKKSKFTFTGLLVPSHNIILPIYNF